MQQSFPVNSLEKLRRPWEKCTSSRALEESTIPSDTIEFLLPEYDRLDSLIALGGLLLVVSHLFAVSVLILWARLEKSKELKLGYEVYFCRFTY